MHVFIEIYLYVLCMCVYTFFSLNNLSVSYRHHRLCPKYYIILNTKLLLGVLNTTVEIVSYTTTVYTTSPVYTDTVFSLIYCSFPNFIS